MSLSEENIHKRKEEIRKIHHVIDVYHKRGWVEQEKYEKYLRILDKIKVNDDEYLDKMHKFRKKVEHIKKSNSQHPSSKSIRVDGPKEKEISKVNFDSMEEPRKVCTTEDIMHSKNARVKTNKLTENPKIMVRTDDSENIELSLDVSKTTIMKPMPIETNKENDRKSTIHFDEIKTNNTHSNLDDPNTSIHPEKDAMDDCMEPIRTIQSKNVSTSITKSNQKHCKFDRQETERIFVEMCVFARLGFIQPPSCLRCSYNKALKDTVSSIDETDQTPCERIIAWRKDASKKISPVNIQETLTFVKCHDAKEWAIGHAVENMRWDEGTKRLLHVQ